MTVESATTSRDRRFWIGVASRSHIAIGVAGSFAQANHGKQAPLRRMRGGDGIALYSPKTDYPDGDALQAFTAVGVVRSGEVYQADMGGGFLPFRTDVDWVPCEEAPIRPLLGGLSFIRDAAHWAAAFRFGHLEVPEADFRLIAAAMDADLVALGLDVRRAGPSGRAGPEMGGTLVRPNERRAATAAVLVLLLVAAMVVVATGCGSPAGGVVASPSVAAGDAALARAYDDHDSGVEVEGSGTVVRLLADDQQGDRHQRFVLRLDSGQTLLVAHNIDVAPRVEGLRVGDQVDFRGVYEWNDEGGVIHWTHRDPSGEHFPGWLRHDGRTVQ